MIDGSGTSGSSGHGAARSGDDDGRGAPAPAPSDPSTPSDPPVPSDPPDLARSLRLIVERMAEGAVSVTQPRGEIVYCNQAFANMLRRPLADVLGKPIARFLVEPRHAPLFALWSATTPFRADYELIASDGTYVPVAIASAAVDGTQPRSWCLVVTDLTPRIDVDRLQQAQHDLEVEARRKDDFIAMLGHELRNPLAPIRHAAELLGSEELGRDELRTLRSTIIRQVEHMRRLVDDLLDMARIARGRLKVELRPVDVRDVVATAVEATRALFEPRRRTLVIAKVEQPLWVDADPVRLTQVVTNLLTNAAKFTNVGGRVALEIESSATEVVVSVRDDGRGIDPDMLSSIFDAFVQEDVTVDRASGGLGLGLALVKRIVDLHHGRVEAISEGKGRGSCFVVRLPRLHRGAPVERPRRRPAGPGRGDTMRLPIATDEPDLVPPPITATGAERRVLVCDDNVDAAEMMALVLRNRGFEVRTVHEGERALAEAQAFRPGFLLLDVGLPDIDGYTVARRLRSDPIHAGVVVAAITGYGQSRDREAALAAGCDFHLIKPVAPERLEEVLAFRRSAAAGRS